MNKILAISPNWIGDAVMCQPLFALLKQAFPDCQIDALAPPWVAPILRLMPALTQVTPAALAHGKLQLADRWRFARQLHTAQYDAAIVLPNSLKSALIPFMAGIPLRAGYVGEQRYGLLNRRLPKPEAHSRMVMRYAHIAHLLGVAVPDFAQLPAPQLVVSPADQQAAWQRFLPQHAATTTLLAFCPGAEFGTAKRWPMHHYVALTQQLLAHYPAAQIVLLGSAKDAPYVDQIVQALPHVTALHNLCGKTSLIEAAALLAQSQLAVCNDSGLLHVAAALNTPLVATFGATDPRHTPPLSAKAKVEWLHPECAPCFQRECPLGHHRCMEDLLPAQVAQSCINQINAWPRNV